MTSKIEEMKKYTVAFGAWYKNQEKYNTMVANDKRIIKGNEDGMYLIKLDEIDKIQAEYDNNFENYNTPLFERIQEDIGDYIFDYMNNDEYREIFNKIEITGMTALRVITKKLLKLETIQDIFNYYTDNEHPLQKDSEYVTNCLIVEYYQSKIKELKKSMKHYEKELKQEA